ncbi:MAG TPA: tetratricopeptide repeat-containing sensor histidine kinase [Candidatus Kapabacteria bacterium]|nr:tetratricopeptide repeat-containing sensor histidine kinase [Candidatus Kapabacteria bacterium]
MFSDNNNVAESISKELIDNENNSVKLDSICLAYYQRYGHSDLKRIDSMLSPLMKIYNKSENKKILGWYDFFKGLKSSLEDMHAEAIYNYEESLVIFRETENYLLVAYAYNQLGMTYYQQGNNKTAIEYLLKSLKTFQQYNHYDRVYSTLTILGLINLDFDPYKTIEYGNQAIEIVHKFRVNTNLSFAYLQMSKAYTALKDFDNAQKYLNLSIDMNKTKKNSFVSGLNILYQAQLYKAAGNLDEAYKLYNNLTNSKLLVTNTYLFTIFYNMAAIKMEQKDYKQAIKFYTQAIPYKSKSEKKSDYLINIYKGLAESYSKTNRMDSAVHYYNLYINQLNNTITYKQNEEGQKVLFNYELNKKELELQKVLLESKDSQNHIQVFIIIAAVIIIIILLSFTYIYYKSYRKNFELSNSLKDEIDINKSITNELIIASKKIEESDNFKSAIIRNMTHEIRTPFNGLLGFVSLIKKRSNEIDDEELKEYSDLVEVSGRRVYELISNLNDLALLESNDYQFHFSLTYLPDIINEVYYQYLKSAKNKDLDLVLGNIDDLVFDTDSVALSKALKNVIDNAVKFTSTGQITINTKYENESLEIFVTDTGIGISNEHISNIGKPFKQVDMCQLAVLTKAWG